MGLWLGKMPADSVGEFSVDLGYDRSCELLEGKSFVCKIYPAQIVQVIFSRNKLQRVCAGERKVLLENGEVAVRTMRVRNH